MTSKSIRDPKQDHLLTPENCAFLLIDYQPAQVNSLNSGSRAEIIHKIVVAIKAFKYYHIPIVLSTVNVETGRGKETIPILKQALGDTKSYDRTSINAFEDEEFHDAVLATGRKKLIISALWTEACLSFPTLDALKEGFSVYPLVDTVGGTSKLAHETALRRLEQAGAELTIFNQVICELQRDWSRTDTVPGFTDALYGADMFLDTRKSE